VILPAPVPGIRNPEIAHFLLKTSPNLEQIRDRARYELSRLPEPCRRLQTPEPYPVHFSRELEALLEDLRHGLTQLAGKKGA